MAAVQTDRIAVDRYPQLKLICWNRRGDVVDGAEALDIYERNWRHVDVENLNPDEKDLIDQLVTDYGQGYLCV